MNPLQFACPDLIETKMVREMGTGLSNEQRTDLDTPDGKAYQKAKALFIMVTMSETIAKRHCLSFAKIAPSVSLVSISVPSILM